VLGTGFLERLCGKPLEERSKSVPGLTAGGDSPLLLPSVKGILGRTRWKLNLDKVDSNQP